MGDIGEDFNFMKKAGQESGDDAKQELNKCLIEALAEVYFRLLDHQTNNAKGWLISDYEPANKNANLVH